jgi:hypothetical protein
MRSISLLIAGTLLASCTAAAYEPPARTARSETRLQQMLAGKIARPPISCLPNYNANDMTVIDGRTLAFRQTSNTTYIMHLSQGCDLLGSGPYALLSRQFGGQGLCRGDIQQVIDTMAHTTVGSCTIADIVPYVRG